jgi:hypothetical protein
MLVTVMNRKLKRIFVASTAPNSTSASSLSYRILSTALKNTMLTASFKTPSPNRIELSLGYFASFTIEFAATVSVADNTHASKRHSFAVRVDSAGKAPLKLKNTANMLRIMKLIKVPTNPYKQM